MKRSLPLILGGALIGALALIASRDSSTAAPVSFVETFDGAPVSPGPFESPHRGSFPSGGGWQSERWLYIRDPALCSLFSASP